MNTSRTMEKEEMQRDFDEQSAKWPLKRETEEEVNVWNIFKKDQKSSGVKLIARGRLRFLARTSAS